MKVADLIDELLLLDGEREITVENTDGWRYDFQISDDEYLTISPLQDTRYAD